MTNRNNLIILYGDVDFDGRTQRMIKVAEAFGAVSVIDASKSLSSAPRQYDHRRVVLKPRWGLARRHFAFWWQVFVEARRQRPNLVFAEDFFTTFPGWVAARVTGAKLIYDAHELIVPELGAHMSLRDRFWYLLERFVVPRADLVIAANSERAEIMAQHYRLRRSPTYMRNIPAVREVTSEQRAAALEAYPALRKRSDDERILFYQGDVSLARGLARFVEVLDHLPETYRLIIVGDGPDLEKLKQLAALHERTGRFAALGRIPNDVLPAVTVHADIGIVTYPHTGLNNIYCAPNKVFEYAQAGLPMIASDQPPILSLLSRYRIGLAFSNRESIAGLAKKISILSIEKHYLPESFARLCADLSIDQEMRRVYDTISELYA